MLSVVVLMAVTFLSVTRRERASVDVASSQADTRLMADAALARAQAEIASRFLSVLPSTNAGVSPFNYDLLVSTNYISSNGFRTGLASPLNVNYTYQNGQPLNQNDSLRNIANLLYDPRPPVFIQTNANRNAPLDFRFYLDFNQNGRFETNGWFPELLPGGRGGTLGPARWFHGDPEWIGVLQRPDFPHSGSNLFVGRYAYLVLPAGKTLDLNFIHNQAKRNAVQNDGYSRHQGVGSWELNLAAFLVDLNTNSWPPGSYIYRTDASPSGGNAFLDALTLLRYRYRGDYRNTLRSADNLFGTVKAATIFHNPWVDYYSDKLYPNDRTGQPWSGSDNPVAYFDVQEVYRTNPVEQLNFFRRLILPSRAGVSSYDRYTFYRLLEQMGVDSVPATRGKMNLNFTNDVTPVSYTNVVSPTALVLQDSSMTGSTNFTPWTPAGFLTNAAQRMLQASMPRLGLPYLPADFGVGNIPIWPTNFLAGEVHRLLQVAANVYDATTNRFSLSGIPNPPLPSVFRPIFRSPDGGANISVVGWQEVTNDYQLYLNYPWKDLNIPADRAFVASQPGAVNVFGIPWIIGARKGYPNFNEFNMQTTVDVTRKVELTKRFPQDKKPSQTNQMFLLGVTSQLGTEAWNSYQSNNYPRQLDVRVTNVCSMTLVDSSGTLIWPDTAAQATLRYGRSMVSNTWTSNHFSLPLITNRLFLPSGSAYRFGTKTFITNAGQNAVFEIATGPLGVPDWNLHISNRLQYIAIDTQAQRVVDFVNLDGLNQHFAITADLLLSQAFAGAGDGRYWDTNRVQGSSVPNGIVQQILTSCNAASPDWGQYSPIVNDKGGAARGFAMFIGLAAGPTQPALGAAMQAPFTPTRKMVLNSSWQVNDPLVHYTLADLDDAFYRDQRIPLVPPSQIYTNSNLGLRNPRCQPWGGNPDLTSGDENQYNAMVKDPLVRNSDDWDFPTNKFPTIGYLGRVHRGTPWQTMYLKAGVVPSQTWTKWAGSPFTHPINDWELLDIFTTAPNANAARGLLSVNQEGRAAWSAALSGVNVVSNSAPDSEVLRGRTNWTEMLIQPGSPQLQEIVADINNTRATYPNGRFPTMGAVLASKKLTIESPFLDRSTQNQLYFGITDAAYERIPLQILSLLRADEPRVTVYAFGQSLKPAANSRYLAPGVFNQLCTNYQITGELVTKTVLRFEPVFRPTEPNENPFSHVSTNGWRTIIESYNIVPND
jgi:hypothetical protein